MPVVRITIRSGKGSAYKKALLDGIHDALVHAFRIPEQDRFQSLQEIDREYLEAPPSRTDDITLIEITAYKGRSNEAKKQLYETIAGNLANDPGIKGDDVLIILHEPALENWGIRGGKPASEVSLGFKIDV